MLVLNAVEPWTGLLCVQQVFMSVCMSLYCMYVCVYVPVLCVHLCVITVSSVAHVTEMNKLRLLMLPWFIHAMDKNEFNLLLVCKSFC